MRGQLVNVGEQAEGSVAELEAAHVAARVGAPRRLREGLHPRLARRGGGLPGAEPAALVGVGGVGGVRGGGGGGRVGLIGG